MNSEIITLFEPYDDLYINWRTSEGEKDIFKLKKTRKRKIRDFDHVKYIKSDNQKVLVEDNDLKERWREHDSKQWYWL